MRFYPKPDPEPHTVVEQRLALFPTFVEGVWVWLERYDVLYDCYGQEYYHLPKEDKCQDE